MAGSSELQCNSCGGNSFQSRGQTARNGKVFRNFCCKNCGTWKYVSLESMKVDAPEKFVRSDEHVESLTKKKKFLITSAQNNTKTNKKFLEALLTYCSANDSELLVIPIRYANPNSFHVGFQSNYEWDENLRPYFIENRLEFGAHVQILGDYYITATASNPLSSIEQVLRNKTTIVGHGRLQMKTLAVLSDTDPVIATTTGTLSVPNYSSSKSGYIAEIHHTNSAVVLEIDDENNTFHLRHVTAGPTGGFYDLDRYYDTKSSPSEGTSVLVLGDEHALIADKTVSYATFFAEDSLVKVLQPKYLVRHDLFDGFSISHHHDKDVFLQARKQKEGSNSLLAELTETKRYLEETSKVAPKSVNLIVPSNHNEHLMQWLNSKHAPFDLVNFAEYAELRTLVHDSIQSHDPFELWLERHMESTVLNRTEFLSRRKSFQVNGVELSMHGDVGANGSRGSRTGLAKLGVPAVIGHSHSPGIENKIFQTGTSTNRFLSYNRGPSGNLNTHCVVYPDGNCQLITVIRGRWRVK